MFQARNVELIGMALLLAVGAHGCDKKQKPDPNEFKAAGSAGGDAGAAAKGAGANDKAGGAGSKAGAPEADFKGTAQYLPRPEVAEWKQGGKVRTYRDNLYELINGAAEQYKEYGFKELATTDYNNASVGAGKGITIEIYDMGSPLGAFGIFSKQTAERDDKGPEIEEISGAKASPGDGQLMLWKGQYLARINWQDESAKADQASAKEATSKYLKPIAKELAKKLPGDANDPEAIRDIPTDGLVSDRVVYYPKEVPSFAGVGPGFTLSYDQDKRKYRVMVVKGAEPAKSSMLAIKKLITGPKPMKGVGQEAVAGNLEDGSGIVVMLQEGLMLAVYDPLGTKLPPGESLPQSEKVSWLNKAIEALK